MGGMRVVLYTRLMVTASLCFTLLSMLLWSMGRSNTLIFSLPLPPLDFVGDPVVDFVEDILGLTDTDSVKDVLGVTDSEREGDRDSEEPWPPRIQVPPHTLRHMSYTSH